MIKPSNMTSNCPTCCHKSFIVSKDIIFLIVLWIMNFFFVPLPSNNTFGTRFVEG